MSAWLLRHLQTAIAGLGKLSREPAGTLLTLAVIGVALALPAGLHVLVRNGEALAGGWDSVRDFSVYLVPGTPQADAEALRRQLADRPGMESVQLVTAEAALAEFRDSPGLAGLVDALASNPLPHTLVARPSAELGPEALAALRDELAARSDVDQVRLDTGWVARLNAVLDLVRRGIWLAAVVLVAAVIAIVGNTIRLEIQNQRAEIEVAKLLGATDGFVRRPFLYLGFWYGLGGSLLALLILLAGLGLLGGPARRLSELYGGGFQPLGLDGAAALAVLGGGLAAGLGGAWLAVSRHLAAIQPRI